MELYDSVKHFFRFPLSHHHKTKRRFGTISWKTYYNTLVKRKGKLFGEIPEEPTAVLTQRSATTTTTITTTTTTTKAKTRRTTTRRMIETAPAGAGTGMKRPPQTTQAAQTGVTQRTRKRKRRRQQQGSQQQQPATPFLQAFSSLTPAAPDATTITTPPTECSLGDQCSHTYLPGYQKCKSCGGKIHHLCAIDKGWLDPNNELSVYCSLVCLP